MPSELTPAGPGPFHQAFARTALPPRGETPAARKKGNGRMTRWFGLLACLAIVFGFMWFAREAHWSPKSFQSLLLFQVADDRVFVPGAGMEAETARQLYRDSLGKLGANDYEAAISGFKQLENVYPGLRDLLYLHQAEAYAGQGNEWAVQKKLTALAEEMPQSPLVAVARYRMGQSHHRASEWEKARGMFSRVRSEHPDSEYAIGSLYYLGELALKEPGNRSQAAALFTEYLRSCPNCRFSGEAARQLDALTPHPDREGHLLIGQGYGHAGLNASKAMAYLKEAPLSQTWLLLGGMQIRAGLRAEGVQTLMDGVRHARNMDEARQGIDWILAYSPADQRVSRLNILNQRNLATGGDYVLWKLAQLQPAQAQPYYQAILSRYPDGDYAPESGWLRLWPMLSAGQTSAYVSQAQDYLARYPYGKAAPKALFWVAKVLEKNSPSEATRAYQHLRSTYPDSYYAFRASGRLRVLTEGQPDPGWRIAHRTNYPPAKGFLADLHLLPPADAFDAQPQIGAFRRQVAEELQAIGAAEDMKLYLEESLGEVPPAMRSWMHHVSGERAQGIRVIRDALADEDQALRKRDAKGRPRQRPDEMKLLYPVYFADHIAPQAARQGLDPYLVQSLMREESYFNELAVSTSNALGLMQLLPSTAREVAGWEKMGGFVPNDLFKPAINVRLGTRYLGYLHQQFNGNGMLAVGAYNGGPGAMKRWASASPYLASDPDMYVERIPYEQTRDYIKKVHESYWNYHRLYGTSGN